MRQLIYVSSRAPAPSPIDLAQLLETSRHNNRRDDVTGLLFSDGQRFLQVVEGPDGSIERLLTRLGKDRRHRAMMTLSRRTIAAREFGEWSMATIEAGEDARSFGARIKALCRDADPRVLGTFAGLIEARSVARA